MASRNKGCWLVLSLSLLSVRVAAQLVPVGQEIQVNATTDGPQASPSSAFDARGRHAVVWQGPGDGTDVWLQLWEPDGSPLVSELRVNSQTVGCQQSPVVAFARDGGFVVAWQSEGQDGDGWGIFAQRFHPDGTLSGPETQINATTTGDQQAPAVAYGPSNQITVAWESFGQDGDGWGVYARQLDASEFLSGEVRVAAETAGDQRHPAIGAQPSGHVVAAWEGPDGFGSGIFLRRFAVDLTAPGSEVAANPGIAGFQSGPAIALDGSGNVVAAWEASQRDGSASGIVARRFDRFLVPLTGELDVNAATAGLQSRPQVASASSGDFLISWESWNQDAGGPGVFARSFDFLAQPADEFRVNTFSPEAQRRASLAASPAGEFLAAWESLWQDGDASGIFAQRYMLPGLDFYTVQPCRLFDSRTNSGPPLQSGVERVFGTTGICGIPATARALSVNLTALDATGNGNISLFPGDAQAPGASSINFSTGLTRANNAIVALARSGTGRLTARATVNAAPGQVHVIVDVNGYFQ